MFNHVAAVVAALKSRKARQERATQGASDGGSPVEVETSSEPELEAQDGRAGRVR